MLYRRHHSYILVGLRDLAQCDLTPLLLSQPSVSLSYFLLKLSSCCATVKSSLSVWYCWASRLVGQFHVRHLQPMFGKDGELSRTCSSCQSSPILRSGLFCRIPNQWRFLHDYWLQCKHWTPTQFHRSSGQSTIPWLHLLQWAKLG